VRGSRILPSEQGDAGALCRNARCRFRTPSAKSCSACMARRRTRPLGQSPREHASPRFQTAAGEELIPFDAYHRLTAVSGLQKGRTSARETEPICPVADRDVDETLPYLRPHVRGLIEFMRFTGCRPGEACRLGPCDIDTSNPVWLYRPIRAEVGGERVAVELAEHAGHDLGPTLWVRTSAGIVPQVTVLQHAQVRACA